MKKLVSLLTITSMVVFALFVVMASLVTPKQGGISEPLAYTPIEFVEPPKDSTVKTNERKIKPPPKPRTTPPSPTPVASTSQGIDIDISVPGPSMNDSSLDSMDNFVMADHEARPIVRVSPKYPAIAAREGKEGWVILSFSINELGAVTNIEIVESNPKRTFDKEAKRALKKWKYKAKLVDGQPVAQHGMTVQLDFTLDQANG
ncbi:energy transducer TonB [Thalassotalea sp. HSM 43]|uniref:energy transducer TonB n=1 Tax=Thalassotalea sp. HSM 43 TaxID=2552945 RepID=UPI0010817F54|nr:energy transducer TonB [Thalassotalea sp. HSM 43]QBY03077.1 energy transducer TonB [Thalassotalea sp. HSM 43]